MEKGIVYGIREAQSEIGVFPIGPKAILKAEFKVTIAELVTADRTATNLLPSRQKVVAFGNDTHTIEIGDYVLINPSMVSPANFSWNKRSLHNLLKEYVTKKDSHLDTTKIDVIEYSYVNNFTFDIMAIDTNTDGGIDIN